MQRTHTVPNTPSPQKKLACYNRCLVNNTLDKSIHLHGAGSREALRTLYELLPTQSVEIQTKKRTDFVSSKTNECYNVVYTFTGKGTHLDEHQPAAFACGPLFSDGWFMRPPLLLRLSLLSLGQLVSNYVLLQVTVYFNPRMRRKRLRALQATASDRTRSAPPPTAFLTFCFPHCQS